MDIMGYIRTVISFFNYFCMAFTVLLSVIYILQNDYVFIKVRKDSKSLLSNDYERYMYSDNLLPISLLIPAYNEEENVVQNIKSLLKMDYPNFEIIVVNDGSSDKTHEKIVEAFNLYQIESSQKVSIPTKEVRGVYYNVDYPNLLYIDKENGGKSDALNAGINASSYPLFACLDADSRLEKDALLKLSIEFNKDKNTIVAGGIVRIANGSVIRDGSLKVFLCLKKLLSVSK